MAQNKEMIKMNWIKMNWIKMIFAVWLIFAFAACERKEASVVAGIWEFVGDENCNVNYLGLIPFIYPYARFGHKVYFTDSTFFNPSQRDASINYLPMHSKYSIQKNKIFIEGLKGINYSIVDSSLSLSLDGCLLKFKKVPAYTSIHQEGLTQIAISVWNESNVPLDSINFSRDDIWSENDTMACKEGFDKIKYLSSVFDMAEMIYMKNLNKVYDYNTSDTYKYTLYLSTEKGACYYVTSFGKFETPFEVKILIPYLLASNNFRK